MELLQNLESLFAFKSQWSSLIMDAEIVEWLICEEVLMVETYSTSRDTSPKSWSN